MPQLFPIPMFNLFIFTITTYYIIFSFVPWWNFLNKNQKPMMINLNNMKFKW
uniref:ATP synthase F0 subunit 8 n=1 Tax=Laemobothrion maximum TaxID=2337902 RepID=UPI00257B7D00|nr:ATP synthase F0 subunit 8 [Laemobothrion maximum]WGU50337.1 ATP synthase subunit 8 [Laemobothrion maximum]